MRPSNKRLSLASKLRDVEFALERLQEDGNGVRKHLNKSFEPVFKNMEQFKLLAEELDNRQKELIRVKNAVAGLVKKVEQLEAR